MRKALHTGALNLSVQKNVLGPPERGELRWARVPCHVAQLAIAECIHAIPPEFLQAHPLQEHLLLIKTKYKLLQGFWPTTFSWV